MLLSMQLQGDRDSEASDHQRPNLQPVHVAPGPCPPLCDLGHLGGLVPPSLELAWRGLLLSEQPLTPLSPGHPLPRSPRPRGERGPRPQGGPRGLLPPGRDCPPRHHQLGSDRRPPPRQGRLSERWAGMGCSVGHGVEWRSGVVVQCSGAGCPDRPRPMAVQLTLGHHQLTGRPSPSCPPTTNIHLSCSSRHPRQPSPG